LVEAAGAEPPLLVERHEPIEIGLLDRAPERPLDEIRRDLLGTGPLALRDLRHADEDLPAARRRRDAGRVERPDQIDAADRRDAGRAVVAEAAARRVARDHLVVQRARALHEGRNYFPSSRFNIDRYISESAHYLCSSRGTAPVREREILRPADVRAEHLLAVDEHDERMPGLHSARIETDREVLEREPILPVGGERIDEAGAAAAAEGHAVDVGALILVRRRNIGRRNLGLRLAGGKMRGRARQIEVLL